ncbi:hypothetical protein GCM10010486_17810 [Nonomuraea roseoviolacea subsp. carminata]|uniref:Uncharacterized protein n=1 Tax=Nonomuraea roseoviolacea subsp. carminata TaxID=160689 RepID=A0ABT1K3C4_9ACTN|nr:hypothetical protein [Nonomuraea roseoviolacea subsp. carminata]
MPDPQARLALVAGLRALAQLIHDRPDIPAPHRVDVYHLAQRASDDEMRAEIDHIAALLGTTTEERNGHYSTFIRLGAVEYQATAHPRRLPRPSCSRRSRLPDRLRLHRHRPRPHGLKGSQP